MDADEVGAGLDELARLRLDDRGARPSGGRGSGLAVSPAMRATRSGKNRKAGRETAVRDVDVMEIDVGLDAVEVALEIGEIGRPEREFGEQPVARARPAMHARADGVFVMMAAVGRGSRRWRRGSRRRSGDRVSSALGVDLERNARRGWSRRALRAMPSGWIGVAAVADDQRGHAMRGDLGAGHAGADRRRCPGGRGGEGGGVGTVEEAEQRGEIVRRLSRETRARCAEAAKRARASVGRQAARAGARPRHRCDVAVAGVEGPGRTHQDQAERRDPGGGRRGAARWRRPSRCRRRRTGRARRRSAAAGRRRRTCAKSRTAAAAERRSRRGRGIRG